MPGVGLMLLLVVGVSGPTDADLLAQAEASFRAAVERRDDHTKAEPHLRAAIRDLEALQRHGVSNPRLTLQLGNARLLADDLGGAILAYHQGLALSPNDRDLRAALDFARSRVAYPAGTFARPPTDDLPPWLPRPGPGTLLLIAVGAFALGCVGLTRWRMLASGRWLSVGVVALLIALAGTVLLVMQQRAAALEKPLVVVAADDVLLRRGDGLSFPPRYATPLPRGTEARLRRERGDWLQVELSGGEIGWVPRELTRTDAPASAGR